MEPRVTEFACTTRIVHVSLKKNLSEQVDYSKQNLLMLHPKYLSEIHLTL